MATGLENLKVYKLAEELEIEVHQLTKNFPKEEKFRSVDQLRRSSSSVSNNVAEAYNRFSYKDRARILYIAKGEAEETKRNIQRCGKKDILDFELSNHFADKYTALLCLISGYIRYLKKEIKNNKT